MDSDSTGRALTYDEKKAAEAAFTGRPFNPEWSDMARKVYEGITNAMRKTSPDLVVDPEWETVGPLA